MFVTSNDYEKVLKEVVAEDGDLLLAVAFWGRGSDEIILSKTGRKIKLICNLRSGATNPDTIDSLRNAKGVDVRQHDRLHAKVILGSCTALVGSANLSSNGLNLEADEVKGWEEAGVLTRDPAQLSLIAIWFASLWRDSLTISDEDIKEAKEFWGHRRATRINFHRENIYNGIIWESLSPIELRERPVYLIIYRGIYLPEEAVSAYRKKKKELTGQTISSQSNRLPPFYLNWKKLPKDAHLIDIYYRPRGSLRCGGVFTRTYDIPFKYRDGDGGQLLVCKKENNLLGQRFSAKDSVTLVRWLEPHIEAIWSSRRAKGDRDGKYISLADAVEILANKSL